MELSNRCNQIQENCWEENLQISIGTDTNLDEVYGQILVIKPSPNIREIGSEVRQEESGKKLWWGQLKQPSKVWLVVLPNQPMKFNKRKEVLNAIITGNLNTPKAHVGKFMGSLLITSPSWPQPKQENQGNNATTQAALHCLQKVPSVKNKQKYYKDSRCQIPQPPSSEMDLWLKIDNFPASFQAKKGGILSSWIIDFGASDHMTIDDHSKFYTFL